MNNNGITRLDMLRGATTFRQGHYDTLAFTPRNAAGEVVDLTGKTIDVVIVGKYGIVYETTGTFDALDNSLQFNISKNIGYGDMWLEITVTDPTDANYRQKFPTSEYEGKLKFIRSADDVDYVGFSGKTVQQFEADQTEFKNKMQQDFDTAVAAATKDAEVALARKDHATLGQRLDVEYNEFTVKLADTNKYKVEQFPLLANEKDDTLRIKRAIASKPTGEVIFDAKTYNTSEKIVFDKSNTTYRGILGAQIISTANDFPVVISGTDIVIDGIEFRQANTNTIYKLTLEFAANSKRITIRNCKFIGSSCRINISNLGISDVTIENNYFEEGHYGILVNEGASDMRRLTINNNKFLNMLGDSIELNTPNVRGVGLKEVTVTNNIMQRDLRYMIKNGLSLGDPNNKNIGHAFGSSGLSDAVISGNVIDGYYWAGIDLEDESERVNISDNKIKNCYGDAPEWTTNRYYRRNDMVKSGGKIYFAETSGTSGGISPGHASSVVSDGGVDWLFLTPVLNSSPSFPTGINIQDADYITISDNVCYRTGFAGITLERRIGYVGADDNIGNTYGATINGNTVGKCVNGIYIATDGKRNISINGNTFSENANAGIHVRLAGEGIILEGNVSSENHYGIYLDEVYTELNIGNNLLSKNNIPVGTSTNTFRSGAIMRNLSNFKRINISSGTNSGFQEMFTLGRYAKGSITMSTRSNLNDYVTRIWEISWDGTTLTQAQVYSLVNGSVGSAVISMSGSNIGCSLTNNGQTGEVQISLTFNGIMHVR